MCTGLTTRLGFVSFLVFAFSSFTFIPDIETLKAAVLRSGEVLWSHDAAAECCCVLSVLFAASCTESRKLRLDIETVLRNMTCNQL